MLRRHIRTLSGVLLVGLCGASSALAQTKPNLQSEDPYGVVSSTFTNSNTGTQTDITGDVCYTTPPVTAPMSISGTTSHPLCIG